MTSRRLLVTLAAVVSLLARRAAFAPHPATGFFDEVVVDTPTRLPWDFVAASFGPEAARLPRDFDSRRQRYQLFVPAKYTKAKSWPLVVFISPGDDPLGWKAWQKVCEERSEEHTSELQSL